MKREPMMSGSVINLNGARKAKARTQAEEDAAVNRARFGRNKAEKINEAAAQDLATRRLDGKKREPDV